MAWTAPRTWVVGEVTDAAMLNAHFRDNMLASEASVIAAAGDFLYASAPNVLSVAPTAGGGSSRYLTLKPPPTWDQLYVWRNGNAFFQLVGAESIVGSLVTLIASGVTTAGVFGMVTSSASSQAVVVKGLVDASTPLSATVAGNTAQFTVASGALRVQRTAGSVGLLAYAVVVYR
jgi:hypothetical protein